VINHKIKFLYTHYQKCAGTTVRKYLLHHYGDGLDEEIEKIQYRHCSLEVTLQRIRDLGLNPDHYFKFSFCRNPWDICVSEYSFWRTTMADHHKKIKKPLTRKSVFCMENSFKEYIFSDFCSSNFEKIYTIDGDFKIDFVLRKERLQEDFDKLCDSIGVKKTVLSVENTTNHKHYTECYDKETKQIVAEKYAKDIGYFGYEFGGK
jgi:hypothetical protein